MNKYEKCSSCKRDYAKDCENSYRRYCSPTNDYAHFIPSPMHHARIAELEAELEEERAKNDALKLKTKIWCRVANNLYNLVKNTVIAWNSGKMLTIDDLYEHEKQVDDTDEED